MTFETEPRPDLSWELRDWEPRAPRDLKAILIQASDKLDDLAALLEAGAMELELAASLRVGQMDSQSKADEVNRQVRLTLTGLAERMRAAL